MVKHSSYFEAVLQLRDCSPEIEYFVGQEIRAAANREVFVSKTKRLRKGADFYLSSNRFTIKLGRRLKSRFGGELKIAEKLFSKDRQSGKQLYRVNVLFRASCFNRGDFIFFGNDAFRVSGIGAAVRCVSLTTGKPVRISHEDAAKKALKLDVEESVLSKTLPGPEVIHPRTFQSVPVLFSKKPELGTKHKLKVVFHVDKVWHAASPSETINLG